MVLDHIFVDPSDTKHLLASTWALGKPDGGLYVSHDAGAHWTGAVDLRGQSVLSLASAPSDPKIYVAGTLQGVYRSGDTGEHWTLISPAENKEIHEVESIAIDPTDPKIIYAGTWHLPWKTTDGGQTWTNIKQGMIDDSDVFSIIVDPQQAKTVYASACSGIYKSDDAGTQFHKVQGIPSTARRTRVLKQDLKERNVVFAGTTEGLFRTQNGGADWSRMTDVSVIVNDVYVDPADSRHVLLATDRGGILTSNDGGVSFAAANKGFSARQVTSYAADARHPGTIFVGVINDKQFGGVFESESGGLSWFQRSGGLEGRDVFSLVQAPDGALIAGTAHGIFRLEGDAWTRAETANSQPDTPQSATPARSLKGRSRTPSRAPAMTRPSAAASSPEKSSPYSSERGHHEVAKALGNQGKSKRNVPAPVRASVSNSGLSKPLDGGVFAFSRVGDVIYAASSTGLLVSDTLCKSWKTVPGVELKEWRLVSAVKSTIAIANLRSLLLSVDGGQIWSADALPPELTQINALATDDAGEVWVGGLEGLFFQASGQTNWQRLKEFYVRGVNNIYFDAANQRMLVTSSPPGHLVLAIHVPDHATTFWDAGWNLRFARPVGDYMLGATLFDGIVIQPRMIESASATTAQPD